MIGHRVSLSCGLKRLNVDQKRPFKSNELNSERQMLFVSF